MVISRPPVGTLSSTILPILLTTLYILPLHLVLSHLTIRSTYFTLGSFIWLEAEEEYNNC